MTKPARTVPFPARCDRFTLAQHQRLARQFIQLARQDGRSAGDWLRRLARQPGVHPWLLLDQLATLGPAPGHHQGDEAAHDPHTQCHPPS